MSYQKDDLISPLICSSAVSFREIWGDFLLLYPHGCLCFGVYMEEKWRGGGGAVEERILVEEIRLKSGGCNPKGQTAELRTIRLWAFFFLMPFTSKEEAQAVIVGVDLCFEGCSSVWCGEVGGLVMSTGRRVWALNERWERTNEISLFSQA